MVSLYKEIDTDANSLSDAGTAQRLLLDLGDSKNASLWERVQSQLVSATSADFCGHPQFDLSTDGGFCGAKISLETIQPKPPNITPPTRRDLKKHVEKSRNYPSTLFDWVSYCFSGGDNHVEHPSCPCMWKLHEKNNNLFVTCSPVQFHWCNIDSQSEPAYRVQTATKRCL